MSGHRSLRELVNGFGGFGSTSKFQWFLWLVVVIFGYSALWVLRALQGDFSALSDIPVNILMVLGFSTGTVAAAKEITASYVQAGKVTKRERRPKPPPRRIPAGSSRTTTADRNWPRSRRSGSRSSRSGSSKPASSTRSPPDNKNGQPAEHRPAAGHGAGAPAGAAVGVG
jgi:hypothetical protein